MFTESAFVSDLCSEYEAEDTEREDATFFKNAVEEIKLRAPRLSQVGVPQFFVWNKRQFRCDDWPCK